MKPIPPWLLLVAVLVLAAYLASKLDRHARNQFDFWFPLIAGLFITAVLSVCAIGIGYGLSSFIGNHCDQVWRKGWHATLVNMRSSDGVQGAMTGSIFLSVGYVESRQTYYYYTEVGESAFRANHWRPDSNTTIYEEDRKDGEVQQWYTVFKRGEWLNWFATTDEDLLRMDFHVPKGTVVRQEFHLK